MQERTIVPLSPKEAEVVRPKPNKPQRFLSLRDVLDRLTISRSLLYDLIKNPVQPFPSPIHLGRRSVWVEGEVEEYMRDLIEAERNGQ